MVHYALISMENNTKYVINLRDQSCSVAEYQWTLDDLFFSSLEQTSVQHGQIDVRLGVHKTSGAYELIFHFDGAITLPCDRCLADMHQDIHTERCLRVKLGDEYDDDGELVTVPYNDGTLDLSWHMFEFIALEIPLRHVHADGECEGDIEEMLDNN